MLASAKFWMSAKPLMIFTYCTIYTLRWSVQVFDGTYNKVEDPPTPLQAVVVLTFCFRGFSGQSP